MKRFKKILSLILVLLMLFSNLPLPFLKSVTSPQAYAAESVYSDDDIVNLDAGWLSSARVMNGNSYIEEQLFDGSTFYYNITGNLNLPSAGPYGSTILWESSDPAVNTNGVEINGEVTYGVVTRPETGGDKTVFLKATIYKGFGLVEKTFKIGVSSLNPLSEAAVVQEAYDWLSEDLVTDWWGTVSEFPNNLNMPVLSDNGCKISWESSNQTVVELNGTVNRPSYTQGNANVTLTATIAKGDTELQKTFQLTVVALGMSDEERVALDAVWLTDELVLYGNDWTEQEQSDGNLYYDNITGNLNLPTSAPKGSTIYWSSSTEAVVEKNGTVHRPERGDKFITLKALLWNNWRTVEKTYRLVVKGLALATDEESVQADYDWLTNDIIHYGRFSTDITYDVNLPIFGENGSTISWTSSNEAIAPDGTVTQPAFAEGHAAVTLTATVSKGEAVVQKAIDLGVPSLDPTPADDVAIDKAWLTEELILNGNSAGDVKTNLYLPVKGEEYYINGDYKHTGGSISWVSSKPEVVATDGRVTRPSVEQGNQAVRLTATISYYDEAMDTKTFDFIVTPVEEFPVALKYDDFSHGADRLQFTGGITGITAAADRDGNSIQALLLNNDGSSTGGSIFTKNPFHLSEDLSFSTAFSYRNEHPNFALGSGGFTFILQPVDKTVYGLDAVNSKPSLSFTFDTYYYSNPGPGQATTYSYQDSAAVYYNGQNDASSDNGRWRNSANDATNVPANCKNVWIEYDGQAKVLEVRVSTYADRPRDPLLRVEDLDLLDIFSSAGANLSSQDAQDVYLGFTRFTGNAKDKSQIWGWYFKNEATPIDFAPYDFMDLSDITLSANPPAGQASSTLTAAVYSDNAPAAGVPVDFFTSLGWLNSPSVITDSSGQASVVLNTYQAGTATVKAILPGGAMAAAEVQLVLSDDDRVAADRDWLGVERILNGNSALDNITKDLQLPTLGINGSNISWTSSKEAVVALDGKVTRPTLNQGEQEVTLTATISKDGLEYEKIFILKVMVLDGDIAAADRDWLTAQRVLNGNSALDNVTTDVYLPTLGFNGSTIGWASSNTGVVALNGKVTRPTYSQKDKAVTLTATVTRGAVVIQKSFDLTVKALGPNDAEAWYADYVWLTPELVLNGNISLDTITTKLNLPVLAPQGSTISWESEKPAMVTADGTLNRPLYAEGDQRVTLTATVSKGLFEDKNYFYLTVKALGPSDAEAVALDHAWLTEGKIRNGNIHLNNVIGNLKLEPDGPQGTKISWTSNKEIFVAGDGTVTRPTWRQGNKWVTLTATITKGNQSVQKIFNVYLPALDQTTAETLLVDKDWLSISQTLGQNLSAYAITQNLSLPSAGYYKSAITWSSNKPGVISNSGVVTRPEYKAGHETVILTAYLAREDLLEEKDFKFTVLEKPDTFFPQVISTTPAEASANLNWETKEITITFDEDIKKGALEGTAGSNSFGIELISQNSPSIYTSINKNKLTITALNYLTAGENVLVIPTGAVTDMSGNPVQEFRLSFSVEEKQVNNIEVISSTPQDGQRDVTLWPIISFTFNNPSDSDLVRGSSFNDISLRTKAGQVIPVIKALNGNTVTLAFNYFLKPGVVYEINIPSGILLDRFNNESRARTIQFRVQTKEIIPEVVSTYPLEGQKGVDIHQNIEMNFSEIIKAKDCKVSLKDEQGNLVLIAKSNLPDLQTGVLIQPLVPLQPNTTYTVKGLFDSAANPTQLDYKLTFTTGTNTLSINQITPADNSSVIPINNPVEMEFSAPVTRGPHFANITIADAQGNPVPFNSVETGSKVVLTPVSEFVYAEAYTVNIPGGAYQNAVSSQNDAIQFKFTTADRLNPEAFRVNPTSTWLVNRPMTFDTGSIENIYKVAKYEITSLEWDFGDGSIGRGFSPVHTYQATGEYLVKLKLKDNKGFTYQFEETVTINEFNFDDVEMSISHQWGDNLYVRSNDKTDNKQLYKLYLKYNGGLVAGETIKVQLYKNGVWLKDFDSITTTSGASEYQFPFYYEGYNYLGTYELVFTYQRQSQKKVLREPVIINEVMGKQTLRVILYDREDHERVVENGPDTMEFELDGEKKVGIKEWYNAKDGYCYYIKDVAVNQLHTIKVPEWILDDEDVFAWSTVRAEVLVGKRIRPGINRTTFDVMSDKTGKKWLDLLEGVDIGNVTFQFEGNWNGVEPGYYELKTHNNRFNRKSAEPRIKLNPGKELKAGEALLVRMVSKRGAASPWVWAMAQVLSKPALGFGPPLNFSFVNGQYQVSLPVWFSNIIGGKMDMLDDVPLLNTAQSFGMGSDKPAISGTVDGGKLYMNFQGGTRYEESKKKKITKKKVVAIGHEIEIRTDGEMYFEYDFNTNQWKLDYGYIEIDGFGGRSWTKGYHVPKVDIGVDGKLEIGAWVGGTLFIDRRENSVREYSGIIRFRPEATVSIQAGPDWVYIMGYVYGYIPAEVHIPTGRVEAEVGLKAGVKAAFLTYTEDIFEKELYKVQWDNGKERVGFQLDALTQPFTVESDTYESKLSPMSRNYLNRQSEWLAGSSRHLMGAVVKAAGEETNPQVVTMQENIFPDAKVQLVCNGDELWLIWIDDNPERSNMNRTQLRYSVLKDGSWSEPSWLGQDGSADFTPAAASTGNGVLMAWQNIKQAMSEGMELGALIENAEISVTESVYQAGGGAVPMVMLTDDDKFDHSPKLAAAGDKALLVWTKSEGLGFSLGSETEAYLSPANSDRLVFSSWDGSTWSAPAEIEDALPTVMNSSLAMEGEEGLLLYTLDMDNDHKTNEDQELFARIYNGSSWGDMIRLTDNQVSEANAKAVYNNGKWLITWYQAGSIVYKEGLDGAIKTEEFLNNVQSNYEITLKQGPKPQVALVYKHLGEDLVQSLSASFYDIDSGVWSDEITLTEDQGHVSSFSPVFTEDGKLNIAYTQAEIITEVKEMPTDNGVKAVEFKNISDKVDLRKLTYTPVHDLALAEGDGLQLVPEIPRPGTLMTVTATIRNQGDYAEKAALYLYDGPPEEGVKIGEVITELPIPARSSAEVVVEWLVGLEEKDQYDLYAVIRPEAEVTEIDTSNNTLNQKITTTDVEIISLESENLGKDDYLVKATIANRGSKFLDKVQIQLDQGLGKIVETRELSLLRPGDEVVVSLLISAQGLTKDAGGKINLTLRVLLPGGAEDNSPDDNINELALERTPIVMESSSPGQGETQVGINKSLTLGFNMNVKAGAGFEEIILQDDNMNPIEINTNLEGSTLTVTPQKALAYSTRYTLIIPQDALGDAYGHTLEDSYSLSFTTTASSPEVVFAYPGGGMEKVAPDAEIKMQFNQDVLGGPAFNDIALYGPDAEKIPGSVSINGAWLNINRSGQLDENTTYTLQIPKGAVKNAQAEAQQEDYTVEFTTGMATDSGQEEAPSTGAKPVQVSRPGGTSTAVISLDSLAISGLRADNNSAVTLDLTSQVNEDQTIQANLTESALNLLVTGKMGLLVVTGKGDIRLPAALIASLAGAGEKSITITIAENKEKLTAQDRVSAGIIDFSITAGEKPVTKFAPAVTVTMPLDKSKVGSGKRVIVCVYDRVSNSWQPVGGAADIIAGTVTFKTEHFSTYAAFETVKEFADVKRAWGKEEIEILASRRLINGKNNQAFAPNDGITRAEFTALIVRSLYRELAKGKGAYGDVTEGSWYAGAVKTAADLGLVTGTGTGRFEPAAKINREQLATIAYRLYRYRTGTEATDIRKNTFADRADISAYAEEAVNFAAQAGIMKGSGGRFDPRRSATRQEATVVLYRLLEYLGEI